MDGRLDRSCGDCTLCCTLLHVVELNKPSHQPCDYVCSEGCARYDNRPYSCRKFECLWLKGQGPDWARPDNIGVIFDELRPRVTGKVMPLVVLEEFSGAHKQPHVVPLIQELSAGRETILVGPDGYAKTYNPETP